jgi:hypothetical protein
MPSDRYNSLAVSDEVMEQLALVMAENTAVIAWLTLASAILLSRMKQGWRRFLQIGW